MRRILPDRPLTSAERYQRTKKPSPEARRVKQKTWRDSNRDKVAAVNKRHRSKNPAAHRERMAEWRLKNFKVWLVGHAKGRAKKKGIEHSIAADDFELPTHCPVFGMPLKFEAGKCCDSSPTLDRIENDKGYVKGNVIVVSKKANTIKSNATVADLRRVADFYGRL